MHFKARLTMCVAAMLTVCSARAEYLVSDGRGFTAPGEVINNEVIPLAASTTLQEMWIAYQRAIDESDFKRIVTLFSECADDGNGYCQYFLGQGVFEWHLRIDAPRPSVEYGPRFVRNMLRRSYKAAETKPLVATSWRTFYLFGYMGFPRDEELASCWVGVAIATVDVHGPEFRRLEDKCRSLEQRKFGGASWLSE